LRIAVVMMVVTVVMMSAMAVIVSMGLAQLAAPG
jgi:hypothetical protein